MYFLLTILSMSIYGTALLVGVTIIQRHEELFTNSSPKRLFDCDIERKYWIIAISTFGNFISMLCILLMYGHDVSELPKVFTVGSTFSHIIAGIAFLVFHLQTMAEFNSLKRDRGHNVDARNRAN